MFTQLYPCLKLIKILIKKKEERNTVWKTYEVDLEGITKCRFAEVLAFSALADQIK